jgi:hypothetical protein
MPAKTATIPKIRLRVIGSPTSCVPSNPAATGLSRNPSNLEPEQWTTLRRVLDIIQAGTFNGGIRDD